MNLSTSSAQLCAHTEQLIAEAEKQLAHCPEQAVIPLPVMQPTNRIVPHAEGAQRLAEIRASLEGTK